MIVKVYWNDIHTKFGMHHSTPGRQSVTQATKHRRETVERTIATRVKLEREARHWSLETLSKKMEAAGFPVAISSLHRLEGSGRPARVTVDQALAFCEVFDLDFKELTRAQVSPQAANVARDLATYHSLVESLTSVRREVLLAEYTLTRSAEMSADAAIAEAVETWRERNNMEPEIAGEFVEWLAGRLDESPFAGAIGGKATMPPGTPSLLDEDTGR